MSIETDEWLATMRTARKAAIARDEREVSAVSAARLARTVVPENERPARRPFELLALAACIAACALGLMGLRHASSMPVGAIHHEILADRAPEAPPSPPAEAAIVVEAPVEAPPASGVAPSGSARVPLAPPARAKSEAEPLPPLPRPPPPPSERVREDREGSKMKRFELRIDRTWRKHAPPPPRRLPRGPVHEL